MTVEAIDHIERLMQERKAGRVFSLDELTTFEWEAILTWDANEAGYEKAHRSRIQFLFEMLANAYK